jgi:hypothetical protein
MGEEAEIISQGQQGIPVHRDPALFIKIGEHTPVLPQKGMNIPDKVVALFVKSVIVIVSALIGTEFLVGSAPQNITAIETSSIHDAKVFIKI